MMSSPTMAVRLSVFPEMPFGWTRYGAGSFPTPWSRRLAGRECHPRSMSRLSQDTVSISLTGAPVIPRS